MACSTTLFFPVAWEMSCTGSRCEISYWVLEAESDQSVYRSYVPWRFICKGALRLLLLWQFKYTCARLCIRTCTLTCVVHVLAGSENGTRLNGCATRTKGEFISGLFFFTLEALSVWVARAHGDNGGKTGEAQMFIIQRRRWLWLQGSEGRRSKIQRNKQGQDTKMEQRWRTGWSKGTLQRWTGRVKKPNQTKKYITQNKTRQDNEAQMGPIRAMIENCESSLLSFVSLKVKSCF